MLEVNISEKYDIYTTEMLTQWDTNQILKITGISGAITVLFFNRIHATSDPVGAIYREDGYNIDIPNGLLTEPYPIIAFVRVKSGNTYTTRAKIKIPVVPSAKPEDYEYIENISLYTYEDFLADLSTKANNDDLAVERARIDNLIKTSGESIDNAELADIRVGADGVNYENAGTAVRTQFLNLSNGLKENKEQFTEEIDQITKRMDSFDVNNSEMNLSIDNTNTLILLLQKICDKIGIEYGVKLSVNYMGFVSPMDGAYSDWVYNNMYTIGNDIYFSYMFPQTHWNTKKDNRSRMSKYNVVDRKVEYWERMCDGESFAASATIYNPDDNCFYSFNTSYRFKSDDMGKTWTKEPITGLSNSPHYLTRLSNGRLIVAPDSTSLYCFAISDDNGLTWRQFNPFKSNYCVTHCRFYEIENNTIVAYFFHPYINTTADTRNSESYRWYSISFDNGETWSEPEHCHGDLEKAGVSYMTGAFAFYGGVYHCTKPLARRLALST